MANPAGERAASLPRSKPAISIRGVFNGHQRHACRRRQAGLNCFTELVAEARFEERRHGVRHRGLRAIDILLLRLRYCIERRSRETAGVIADVDARSEGYFGRELVGHS